MNKEISTFDANLEKNIGDYMEAYKMVDVDQVYSNGTEFVPIFRVKQWLEYNDCTPEEYNTMAQSNMKLSLENDRLNNIIDEFYKLLIEHIEDARYELNIILHSDNDLNYKNECAREFDVLDKNIRMILDKLEELKEGKK